MVVDDCPFAPGPLWRNAHVQTMAPSLFRRVEGMVPRAERISTPDGDFIDLDRHDSARGATSKVAIICHGLEGHSRKAYILGMAKILTRQGFDVAAWTNRGCSGEPNKKPWSYHSGKTEDLHTVLAHVLAGGDYERAVLVGFSMGANQILKYLGEDVSRVPAQVDRAVAVSAPCDLAGCEAALSRPSCRVYTEYFMRTLTRRAQEKARIFPGIVHAKGLWKVRRLREFDERITAPLNGFKNAAEYYRRSSSKQFLPAIQVPTLILNAKDDPFLPPSCYPMLEAQANQHITLEISKYGGHVGFCTSLKAPTWAELRAAAFVA